MKQSIQCGNKLAQEVRLYRVGTFNCHLIMLRILFETAHYVDFFLDQFIHCYVDRSGVASNFRQEVRQSVAFLSVHSRSAALPSRPYNQKNVITRSHGSRRVL